MHAETNPYLQQSRFQRLLAADVERQPGLRSNRRLRYHAVKFIVNAVRDREIWRASAPRQYQELGPSGITSVLASLMRSRVR